MKPLSSRNNVQQGDKERYRCRTVTCRLNGHRKTGTVGSWDSYLTSVGGWARRTTALLHRAVQELSIPTETRLTHSRACVQALLYTGLMWNCTVESEKMLVSQSHWGRDTGLSNLQKDERPRSQTDAVAVCAVPFTLTASGNQVSCA